MGGRSLKLWEQAELSGRHLAWEGAHVWQKDREPRWVPRYPDRDPAKDRKPHAAPRHLDMDAAKDREALAAPRHSDRDPAKDRERSAGHSMNSFNQTRLWPGVAEVRGTCPD